MTPNGEHQILGPDGSQIFDAGVNVFVAASPMCKPLTEDPWGALDRASKGGFQGSIGHSLRGGGSRSPTGCTRGASGETEHPVEKRCHQQDIQGWIQEGQWGLPRNPRKPAGHPKKEPEAFCKSLLGE